MFINGSNFGTDTARIRVIVGGQRAKIIRSSGTQIYCLVPARADEGSVQVSVLKGDGALLAEHTYEQPFKYIYNTTVGTLWGTVDEYGNAGIADGPFSTAAMADPYDIWYESYGGKRVCYFVDDPNSVRVMDLDAQVVSTLFTKGQMGLNNVAGGIAWSLDRDTMFIGNNQGTEDGIGAYFALRSEGFQTPHPMLVGRDYNCIFVHPTDGTIFLTRGYDGTLHQATYNPKTEMWDVKNLGTIAGGSGWFQHCVFHPSGNYAYLIGRDRQCIQKAMYDWQNKTLKGATAFAGSLGNKGYTDAIGTAARFNEPTQGCFVKNETYVQQGKSDVYDFYLADMWNHCIRKITPEGDVTTYAGRGSWSADEIRYGYIDGDLTQTARFNVPTGICYEESTGTFYITDNRNHRVRIITVQ